MAIMTLPQISAPDPEAKILITGVAWDEYDRLSTSPEYESAYRLCYLEDTLELMSPSRNHEKLKKDIARLLEAYLEMAGIDFWGLGSTTFRDSLKKAGKEPDESYCLYSEKEYPDIAIEVIVSSGGIDILEVYKRLGITEVWLWREGKMNIYHLWEDYRSIPQSLLLPDLDINILAEYIGANNPRLAVQAFRERLQ